MRGTTVGGAALAWLVLGGGCNQEPEGDTPTPPGTDTGWETDFEACAEVREVATRVPVSLLLTVDTSGSMAEGEPRSKWEATSLAFTSFFRDPEASDLGVALRLWPDPDDGCNDTACDPFACSQPQVPVGDLSDPQHRQALVDALVLTPEGFTPLSAALDGATQWARTQQAASPGDQQVVVLVTDGEPNGCDEDIDNIAAIAADASTAGIPVFAVGIEGSAEAQIDQIAQAGGTGAGYFVGSANAEEELLAALQDIQGQVLACTFLLPGGDALNLDLVRVEYTTDGDVTLVTRVADEGACDPDGGWYLDAGDRIVLCPSTCAEAQDVPEISIEIAVGCECEIDPDCADLQVCDDNVCTPCDPGIGETPVDGPPCPGFVPDTDLVLGGSQAVQGGALNCGTAPGPSATWLLALSLLGLATMRRERS